MADEDDILPKAAEEEGGWDLDASAEGVMGSERILNQD
jgi:hypothetical protein